MIVASTQTGKEQSLFPEKAIKNKGWYIFYTCPRAEKVVLYDLERLGYEVFLPRVRTLRVWKNRQRKWIEQVLFPSYIFVNAHEHELFNIKKRPKVSNFLHINGKPSVVRGKEIEGIKKMIELDENFSVEIGFNPGDRVRVLYGPLAGHEGILVEKKGKTRFGIEIEAINQAVFVEIGTSMIERF